jgi:hypothetical protein
MRSELDAEGYIDEPIYPLNDYFHNMRTEFDVEEYTDGYDCYQCEYYNKYYNQKRTSNEYRQFLIKKIEDSIFDLEHQMKESFYIDEDVYLEALYDFKKLLEDTEDEC